MFEVELLEWQDDQDISPDEQEGMVMLRQTTKGPGFTAPQELDTVTIRFRVRTATNPDQSPWEQTTAVVDELNVCRGLEVGVMAMTPGSVGTLTVHPAYAFGDQGSEKYHVAPGEMVHIDLEVLRLEERPVSTCALRGRVGDKSFALTLHAEMLPLRQETIQSASRRANQARATTESVGKREVSDTRL